MSALCRTGDSTTDAPLAKSSSISRSLSLAADMDRYSAVTDMRFDCRMERPPSWDDMVFWRDTWMKDEDEDVEALEMREGCWSIVATDIPQGFRFQTKGT